MYEKTYLLGYLLLVMALGLAGCSGTGTEPTGLPAGTAAVPATAVATVSPPAPAEAILPPSPSPEITVSPTPLPTAQPVPPSSTPVPAAPVSPATEQALPAEEKPAEPTAEAAPEPIQAAPQPPAQISPEEFISRVAPLAQAAQAETGVPASFSIALAAQETGWGEGELAWRYNNHHGLSCSEPNEGLPCVQWGDGRWNQYSSAAEGFLWFARWLRQNAQFASAFEHTDDPAVFAQEVMRCYISCGLPFPQRFYERLIELIDGYDLRQYDTPPAEAEQ